MREKLIELLSIGHECPDGRNPFLEESCHTCPYGKAENCCAEMQADHLIANDVVPVVRCKDCKWYAPNNDGLWFGCAFDTRNKDDEPKADDFCSYGERKEKCD